MTVGDLKKYLEHVPDDYVLVKDGRKAAGVAITDDTGYDYTGGVEIIG